MGQLGEHIRYFWTTFDQAEEGIEYHINSGSIRVI